MNAYTDTQFPVDSSSILFLAQIRKNHTNVYRFSMTLSEEVSPEILQAAVDRIYKRFPSVIAYFRPNFFHYTQIPVTQPPQVQPDPGCLITMPIEDIHRCAYRVYYKGNTVAIEAFHALTDGFGAIASFTTLIAEYLRMKYDIQVPASETVRNLEDAPADFELADAYIDHQAGKPLMIPARYAYQIPHNADTDWSVKTTAHVYPTDEILAASRKHGVSATTLLSTVMASSVMEFQQKHTPNSKKPVRIMVPVDLRRIFNSGTLRNFVLYALPTMESHENKLPLEERLKNFHTQIRSQLDRNRLASIMAYNVRAQHSWFMRYLPRVLKYAALRIGNRFFGETTSSVTVTNLGNLRLPAEMQPYVEDIQVILTPRIRSPYGCAVISYNNKLAINISTFRNDSELDDIFRRNMEFAMK